MPRRILPYNPELKARAKQLRNNATKAEILLWQQLKQRKLGVRFVRQKPIDCYIVDFYSPELCLVIEIDGISHADKTENDRRREQRLESYGLTILRFSDSEMGSNMTGVIDRIAGWIARHTPPSAP